MNELLKERETDKSSQSWFWNEKESLEDRNEVGEKEKQSFNDFQTSSFRRRDDIQKKKISDFSCSFETEIPNFFCDQKVVFRTILCFCQRVRSV